MRRTQLIKSLCNQAMRSIWNIEPADRAFQNRILSGMPLRFANAVAKKYQPLFEQQGRREANLMLLDVEKGLSKSRIPLDASDQDLCDFAKARAKQCQRLVMGNADLEQTYQTLGLLSRRYGIKPPKIGLKRNFAGALARLCDAKWWRRAIRKTHGRNVESYAIKLGQVHKHAGIYASDESVKRRQEQKTRNKQLLEELIATNNEGDTYTLQELADLSVSNPHVKRSELMSRIAGFEEFAKQHGHVGEFYTITCPSRMHARYARNGKENSRYENICPRDAQIYLCKQWAKIRSAFDRDDITVYGFRVAEPQHDGTPHWHLLLFMPPEHVNIVRNILERYTLEIDSDEPGAKKHRFKAVAIDWSKGSAAGYIAKYISKNIDGYKLDCDSYGGDPKSASVRVETWSATWGIRQFQQIGGPPITVWRELRRLNEPPVGILSEAYEAANTGNWAAFVELMGGCEARRKELPIQLAKQYSDKINRYGEPLGYQVFGIESTEGTVQTRFYEWSIEHKSTDTPTDQFRGIFYDNIPIKFGEPPAVIEENQRRVITNLEFCQ